MKGNNLNNKLLDTLRERFPQKSVLANELSDTLFMEKESVYRRLRGEVPFTLDETETLAIKLGISIDSLIGSNNSQFNPLAQKLPNSKQTREEANFEVLINYVEKIKEISQQHNSEHVQALNYIPLGLCLQYPLIAKFLIYRFLHLYQNNGFLRPFKEHKLSTKIEDEIQRMDYYLKNINYTAYIWDPSIITNFVDNINYFTSINLINPDETAGLKKELFRYLDDLEGYAINGKFPKTDNKFSLYIPGVHIGFTHAYLRSESIYMSIFMTFVLQTVTSFDKNICLEVINRIHCLQKLSTLISYVGEKERIDFFTKQREIVSSL